MLGLILKNTAAGYGLKILQMFLGLVAVPVIVSHAGTDGYGLIVLAGTLLGYFAFFDLGLSEAITKYVAQYHACGQRAEVDRIIATSLAVFAVIGGLLCVSVLLVIDAGLYSVFDIPQNLQDEAKRIFLIAAILSLFAWPRLALQGVLRGLQQFVTLNLIIGLGRVLAASLAILAALSGKSLWVVFMAMQVDIFISVTILPFLIRLRLLGWVVKVKDVRWKTLVLTWNFSGWLMLSKVAVLLEYQLDILILGSVLPLAAITAYTVLTYPFRMLQQFSGLAAAAVMPAASALHGVGDHEILNKLQINGARIHNALLAMMTVVILILLEPFLRLWMGGAYLDQIWIAYSGCAFQFFWQSNALLGQVYVGMGLARKPAIVAILTGITNLCTSLVLVYVIGLGGVVMGTVLAGSAGVLLFVIWCLPDIGISWRDYLWRILIGGQFPFWGVGLVLLPLKNAFFNKIDSWAMLVVVAALLSVLMAGLAWFTVIDQNLRINIMGRIRRSFKWSGLASTRG